MCAKSRPLCLRHATKKFIIWIQGCQYTNFRISTDTLQTEALYRGQLSGRPELESLPKSACSLSYEDFKPRHLDQHTIWENPVSLNKPGLPLDVKSEESRILLHKLWHQQACQPSWRPEDGPRQTALPEWIPSCKVPLPSCKVPQNQTALLELQHSFCKTAAQKHFHDSIRGERKDLRGNITEGKRDKFYGFNAFYFFNWHIPWSCKNRVTNKKYLNTNCLSFPREPQ